MSSASTVNVCVVPAAPFSSPMNPNLSNEPAVIVTGLDELVTEAPESAAVIVWVPAVSNWIVMSVEGPLKD